MKKLKTIIKIYFLLCILVFFQSFFGLKKKYACGIDVFVRTQGLAVWYFIVPISVIIGFVFLKNEMNYNMIVRKKNIKEIWLDILLNIFHSGYIITFLLFFSCGTIAVLYGNFYKWNETTSLFYMLNGGTLNYLNLKFFVFMYLVSTFFYVVISQLLVQVIWWWTGNDVMGMLVTIGLFAVLMRNGLPWLMRSGVYYNIWTAPISNFYQFIFPLLLIVVLIGLGYLKRKRDFL